MSDLPLWLRLVLPSVFAELIAFCVTPSIKRFAEKLGAYDYPDKYRHINEKPIARMGGLSIGIAFVVAVVLFCDLTTPMVGMLAGSLLIVSMGILDDIADLRPWLKLLLQLLAALIAYRSGVVLDVVSNPDIFDVQTFIPLGTFSMPLTVLWIVACTNALNLIDGLDGLAVGVSAISAATMLFVSLSVAEPEVSILLAILLGACLGFLPFNFNPASIFMGDVGSQLLGYLLGVISIMGLFKMHALITLFVPLLALAVPLADTVFAFFRRILKGQSPLQADNQHIHHKLMALGLSQKQAVVVLYAISALLGLLAVDLAGRHVIVRTACLVLAFVIGVLVWYYVIRSHRRSLQAQEKSGEPGTPSPLSGDSGVPVSSAVPADAHKILKKELHPMKAAVFSDTHGKTQDMVEAVRACHPDCIIHLGDCERDTAVLQQAFPDIPLHQVCGNCDLYPQAPIADIVSLGPVNALICHGHTYDVDFSTDRLVYEAQERNCRIAMYGHTHRAENTQVGGVQVLNPGTAGRGSKLSFATVEVFPNGGIACEIHWF